MAKMVKFGTLQFRKLKNKEPLQVMVPKVVGSIVREKATRDRRSISATTTELLCVALGISSAEFLTEPEAEPVSA